MGFLKNLFKRKCIIKTEIVDAEDGLDAEEQMCNELLAYEEFGFEGFIDATIYIGYGTHYVVDESKKRIYGRRY